MGDLNDEPGMDYFEFAFAKSAVEIVIGDIFEPDTILRNHAGRPSWTDHGWRPASALFNDRLTEDDVNVLIDHILVSSGLRRAGEAAHQIWNPYDNDDARPFRNDLKRASDHFPVTLGIDV